MIRVLASLPVLFAVVVPLSAAERVVPAADRTDLRLTVYSNGLGLVTDRRRVDLVRGVNALSFEGVATRIVPESARITGPGIAVREQAFEANLLTPGALLEESLGREVWVVRTHPTTGEETRERATVLAVAGGVVLKVGEVIETGVPGRLAFDHVPPGLRPRPALVTRLQADSAGTRDVALAYLTDGLSWRADYTAELNADGTAIDLEAWATLTNATGVDYADARLALVAGDVRRVTAPRARMASGLMKMKAALADADFGGPPARESLAAFHLYRIDGRVSLPRQVEQAGGPRRA